MLAAKGIDVNPDKATAYVLTMHALAVLPVTLMGAILVSPAFPACSAGGASRPRNQADALVRSPWRSRTRGRGTAGPQPGAGPRRALGEPPAAAGCRRQVGLDRDDLLPRDGDGVAQVALERVEVGIRAGLQQCGDDLAAGERHRHPQKRQERALDVLRRRLDGLAEGEVDAVRPRTRDRRRVRAGGWHAACRGGRARRSPA